MTLPFDLGRRIAVLARRRRSRQEGLRIEADFLAWRESQRDLDAGRPGNGELLLIRLDDIGDYLLFRNQLPYYRNSTRWRGLRITLLGNAAWRPLFEAFDAAAVDEVLWVDKGRYLSDAPYRRDVWQRLRSRGIDTVIAPARTRPLLLDDLCMLAAAPRLALGSCNTYIHPAWNRLSDALYGELFETPRPRVHEFVFNGEFAQWACGTHCTAERPVLDFHGSNPARDYLLCFLGANTRSKRWPAKRWIELIKAYRADAPRRVVLSGHSAAERRMAADIQAALPVESIVGGVTLVELVSWVDGARAVVTNDTMTAHLSASLGRPTVIVANGVNHQRFTDYPPTLHPPVATAYPRVYLRKRARDGDFDHHYPDAITADIASIRGAEVLDLLRQVAP